MYLSTCILYILRIQKHRSLGNERPLTKERSLTRAPTHERALTHESAHSRKSAYSRGRPFTKECPYGTPFVTKLEIAYGHHVSELRREKKRKKKRKEELCSLALALTLTLYHLSTSYPGGPVHYTFVICELYYIILTW